MLDREKAAEGSRGHLHCKGFAPDVPALASREAGKCCFPVTPGLWFSDTPSWGVCAAGHLTLLLSTLVTCVEMERLWTVVYDLWGAQEEEKGTPLAGSGVSHLKGR